MKITHDHRMTVQNGDYRRASEMQAGDLVCTSEGDCEVIAKENLDVHTPVFEITFEEDRPVYMAFSGDDPGNLVVFGSEQCVPYNPVEYVEFRFKGHICNTIGLAETWLKQESHDRLGGFDLKFWCSRKFAVWVPHDSSDEFWEMVAGALPKGSKLYRRPLAVSVAPLWSDPGGLSTPPLLTP